MNATHSRQRRHRRFIVNLSTGSEGTWLRDISMRGMRILSKYALRIDEPVETGLDTEFGELHLKGRVVRACRSGAEALPYEYGIELDALDSENDVRLRRYLETLSTEAAVAPENPVDPLDLQRLHDRIEELERALDRRTEVASEKKAPETPAPADQALLTQHRPEDPAPCEPASEQETDPLQTHFGFIRFSHLVRLGQPLIPLERDCAHLAQDANSRTLAEAFSPCFDLETLLGNINLSFDEEKIINQLFHFYERNLIDFA